MRRKKRFFTVAFLLATFWVKAQHNYEIIGQLESGAVSDSVYLQIYDKGTKRLDAAKIENQQFVLRGTTAVPIQVSVKVKGWRRSQDLYVEPDGHYKITLNEDWKLGNSLIGGQENAIRKAYDSDTKELSDEMQKLGNAYEKATEEERMELNEKMSVLNGHWDSIKKAYIQVYPRSLVMLDIMRPQLEVMSFGQLEDLLGLFSKKLAYASTYQHLLAKYEEKKKEQLVGNKAPEVLSKTVAGEDFRLSQLQGKIVLLDFWASWCTPCRVGNKNLKPIYEKYKDKGFEIVSFSLDDKDKLWRDAIQQDGIPWIQISDLVGLKASETASQYHIKSLPTIYLIDTDGKVLAQNINKEELVKILEAKLK